MSEKPMKKMFTLLSILVVISLCSTVLAFDGRPPGGNLGHLPASKEMLFHQTMREVFDTTKDIREQIKGLEAKIKTSRTATDFDAALCLQKTSSLRKLHQTVREDMDVAMGTLASQFTAKEKVTLAEMTSRKPGPPPGR
jgi:uncharacterized membrane protein